MLTSTAQEMGGFPLVLILTSRGQSCVNFYRSRNGWFPFSSDTNQQGEVLCSLLQLKKWVVSF